MKALITPALLLGIIFSLVGVLYANQQKIDDRQDRTDSKLQDTKVDNMTMQLMIERQDTVMSNYKELLDLQRDTMIEYKRSVSDMKREIQAERLSRGGNVVIMNESPKQHANN